ncbi:MAG: NAD-dependent epimerase/dehydratase family protein [Patescibacteria group bacterium]
MKILILGSSGFVGQHLTSFLLKNTDHDLHLLQRKKAKSNEKRVRYFIGSYENSTLLKRALKKVDLVIHLIMSTSPRISNLNPSADIKANLLPTINLLDLMVKAGVKKIIYPSSGCSVYGDSQNLATETDTLKPTSSYGIVKISIEKYLQLYQLLHGIEPLVIRAAVLYGPGYGKIAVHGLITTVLNKLHRNEKITIWGDGKSTRDFLYIDDLNVFFLKAIKKYKSGIYNIGSAKGYSVNEILSLAEKITGKKAKTEYSDKIVGDLQKIVLDASVIKKDFAWEAKTNISDGMKKCWESLSS